MPTVKYKFNKRSTTIPSKGGKQAEYQDGLSENYWPAKNQVWYLWHNSHGHGI